MNAVKASGNPEMFMQDLAQKNPAFKELLNISRMSGSSPKDIFYKVAKEKGVNPEEIIKMLM